MTDTYDPLKDPTADGYTFVGVAVDPAIENALTPEKEDWKEPLWAKFKKWAVGFGAALLVVGAIVAAIAYFTPSLAPDDTPSTMTIEPIPPAVTEKTKAAAKSTSRPADAAVTKPPEKQSEKAPEASNPTIKESLTVEELNKQLEQLNQQLKKGIL